MKKIRYLLQRLKSENEEDRYRTVQECMSYGVFNEIIAALVKLLTFDKSNKVRVAVASILGMVGAEIAIDALIDALHDPDSCVRREAASSLGQIGGQEAYNALKIKLENEENRFVIQTIKYSIQSILSCEQYLYDKLYGRRNVYID